MDGWADKKRMDRRIGGQTQGRMGGGTDGWTEDGRTDGMVHGARSARCGQTDGRTDDRMDGWTEDGWAVLVYNSWQDYFSKNDLQPPHNSVFY